MPDAVVELCARSKDHPELRKFREFHIQHPEVFDFVYAEIRARFGAGFKWYSISSLWHYARHKLDIQRGPLDAYKMNDHLTPFFGRALLILHPELNGRTELRRTLADDVFGTVIDDGRLYWADGSALEDGWRPATPHVPRRVVNLRPDVHAR